ncbi:MAG: hypothetical protein IKG25_05650 [Mogibacterium sp.]|nr:hypothetical protein [Mogibacterium sp.]MBR4090056.1 hypothetical protein [Mogibacterium sp.]
MLSDKQKIEYNKKRNKLPEAERWQMDCPVCLKPINPAEDEAEYVKTKRGTDIWVHTACVPKWGKN